MEQTFHTCLPFVGAIIERNNNGTTQILIQTRWKPDRDPVYSGTFEFPAGELDKPFENVYEALRREIKEETGLTLKSIKLDSQTKVYTPQNDDASFAFKPFCCVQQLRKGKPWIGFIFLCEVEEGQAIAQDSEVKDIRWVNKEELKKIFDKSPEKMFTLEIAAWEYYFAQPDDDTNWQK
jgi:8-oxo-dGTP pyrophosphatase MutT (NUDIX family)